MPSASKSTTLYSSNGYPYTLTASFTENSTNVANNTSSIKVTATLKSINTSWSSGTNSTLIIYWHDNRENYDRQVASINFGTLNQGASKSASGTINVTHKDDGTLSGYAKAKFVKGGSVVWTPASGSVSTNNTALTTIARASQPTVTPSTFNIGDTITIKTNRKSTAFKHTITLYFGNYSYRIATGVTDTVTFDTSTIANQMYQQIPNASVGVGNVTAITYNGSTNIGSKNVLFHAKVTNSSPTFNTAYLDTNSTTTAITGNNQQIIRNNSTLQINVTNAEAKNYATLSRATVTVNGTTYNANLDGSSATFNIGTLNIASDTTAVVSVVDSRGITTSQNLNITILDWVLPTAIINLQRENNFYSETNINVNAEYSSLDNKNTISIKARYKKVSDATYGSYTTLQDDVTSQFTLDNNYAWNVQVLLEDKIGSTTYNLVLDRGIPIAFFDRLKRSVGINCFPADNESLEVDDENILTRIAGYGQEANVVTGDWNTACGEASGYYMGNGLTNSPSGSTVDGWWWVVHIVHNDKYQRQIAYSFLSNEEIYTRIQNNGTWNSWTKVAGSGSGGTSDYAVLTNKPSINGVTLSGNKTTSDIGITIPTTTSNLTNDSGYITKDVNNLTNYTSTSSLHSVATSGNFNELNNKPTKVSDLTNDAGYITGITGSDVTDALGYTPLEVKEFYIDDILDITSRSDEIFEELETCITTNKPFIVWETDKWYEVSNAYSEDTYYYFEYQTGTSIVKIEITGLSSLTVEKTTTNLQEEITSTNKLDYSLISNTPSVKETTNTNSQRALGWYGNGSSIISTINSDNYLIPNEYTFSIKNTTGGIPSELAQLLGTDSELAILKTYSSSFSNINSSLYSRQELYVPNITNNYWYRHNIGTQTYGSWYKVATTDTIPTVNDAKLTIGVNGIKVADFTANASSNVNANITVPTTTNELTNNSGFITKDVNNLTNYTKTNDLGAVALSNDYDDLDNTPTIPSKTSDLTNDSGYIDNTYHDSSKQDTLVSGTNIKTINNQSLLGSGNISISGGGGTATDVQINGNSITSNDVANIITEGTYNASTNKIATISDTKPVVLYTNTSGTLTTLTLNDNVSNYSYLEIFYGWSGGSFGLTSSKFDLSLAGSYTINLATTVFNNSRIYWATSKWTPTGTNLNLTSAEWWSLGTSGSGSRNTSNNIAIYKVLGYK